MSKLKVHEPEGCSIPECAGVAGTRGLCGAHYHRLLRYGDPAFAPARGRTAFNILSPIIGADLATQVVSCRSENRTKKPFSAYRAQLTLDVFLRSSDPKLAAWEYVNRAANRDCLTQQYLKACVEYSPDTGAFTARLSSSSRNEGDSLGALGGSHGYLSIAVAGRSYLAHRLAWFYVHGEWPEQIDHIDRNRHNNRICNLRPCTHQENTWNVGLRHPTRSGVVGVNWNASRHKWVAKITIDQRTKTLGYFDELSPAIAARKQAEQEHRGHFLNKGVSNG